MLTLPVIVAGVVMILALIFMVICAKKQRTYPNAQTFAVFLLLIVVACGVYILYKTGTFGDTETERLIQNELKYAKAKSIVFGKALKKEFPEARVLVISDRNYEKNERQKALVESLKDGLGMITPVEVDTLEMPENKTGMMPEEMEMLPLEEMMTAKDFDKIIAKHPKCNLIVSMIGLPRDASTMKLWTQQSASRPALALLNGDVHSLKNAITAGFINAVVIYRPGVKFTEDACPEDPQEAFDQRFLIVTPKNIEELSQKYKNLFME